VNVEALLGEGADRDVTRAAQSSADARRGATSNRRSQPGETDARA
jgi:hypothetical protein